MELQTLKNISQCLDIPLDLLRYDQVVNRSVMEVLVDVFVSKQRSGARNHIYTPCNTKSNTFRRKVNQISKILEKWNIFWAVGGRLNMAYNAKLTRRREAVC